MDALTKLRGRIDEQLANLEAAILDRVRSLVTDAYPDAFAMVCYPGERDVDGDPTLRITRIVDRKGGLLFELDGDSDADQEFDEQSEVEDLLDELATRMPGEYFEGEVALDLVDEDGLPVVLLDAEQLVELVRAGSVELSIEIPGGSGADRYFDSYTFTLRAQL